MEKLVKYDLGDNVWIEPEPRNWVLKQRFFPKGKDPYTENLGYWPTISGCYRGYFKQFSTKAKSHEELEALVKKVDKLLTKLNNEK